MRILSIAVIAAALATPSAGHPQDQRTIGGPMGQALQSPPPAPPSPPGAQPFVGYPAERGSGAPANLVTTPVPGGMVSAIVNGRNVIIDPSTHVIVQVLN